MPLRNLAIGPLQSEQQGLADFQRFIGNLPGLWWIKDVEGRYLYANRSTEESLGNQPGGIVGKTDLDFLAPEPAQILRQHDQQVLRTGENLEVLETLPSTDGSTRTWYSAKFLVVLGESRCTAGFAIELSRLIQANGDIEGMLHQILDAISDMVLVKGPHSKLQWANKAFLNAYGMTNAELKGLVDAPFSEPDLTQQYVKDDLYVFSTGLTLDIPEEPMIRHDGKILMCHTVKSPIFDARGKVIKTVGVIRDTTERRRLELELRQAQKLESVGRLASGIAHEINTPIQYVGDELFFLRTAFTSMLALNHQYRAFVGKIEDSGALATDIAALRATEEELDIDYVVAAVPRSLDAVQDGTERVANLVRAMKEFGHPDAGEREAMDVNRALRNTVTISAHETKQVANVVLELGEIPEILAYPSDLNQVFLNLLVNAAHAIGDLKQPASKPGTITITTRREGESEIIVSIADTGIGIPEASHSKIFDAFFTTKEIGRGTGQGLPIARMIVVEKHQGSLTFDTKVDEGTTFYVKLPIGDKALAAGFRARARPTRPPPACERNQ
jgi:two-component system, NtrC family, sensor kinase